MRKYPHVALLIETSRAYGRSLLLGVVRYIREHRPWSIYIQPHDLRSPLPIWLKSWRGDGILARVDDLQTVKALRRLGLPTVDLRGSVPRAGFPYAGLDNPVVVRMAYEHLADCGFRQFGFCGLPQKQNIWMDLRRELFQQLVRAAQRTCHVFEPKARKAIASWEQEQEEIAAWLVRLPKPIGIMACNDDRGQQILDACRRANLLVPDEVAVIGVDNDEILCNLSSPPLTSVDINSHQLGYQAAALLDKMMAGAAEPTKPLLLSPRVVVARESTDVLATEDRELAKVLRFIREHACDGLRLKELSRTTNLSRREIERRVRKLLGRSPKEEMIRVQMENAKRLLAETDVTVTVVAEKCGFSQPRYFNEVFHARMGLPPGAYRRKMKKLSKSV